MENLSDDDEMIYLSCLKVISAHMIKDMTVSEAGNRLLVDSGRCELPYCALKLSK